MAGTRRAFRMERCSAGGDLVAATAGPAKSLALVDPLFDSAVGCAARLRRGYDHLRIARYPVPMHRANARAERCWQTNPVSSGQLRMRIAPYWIAIARHAVGHGHASSIAQRSERRRCTAAEMTERC